MGTVPPARVGGLGYAWLIVIAGRLGTSAVSILVLSNELIWQPKSTASETYSDPHSLPLEKDALYGFFFLITGWLNEG